MINGKEGIDENPILFEKNNKDLLLVSFGGIRQGLGMPVFEFNNMLKDVECDKVFIRDFNQAWYHKGINEKCQSIDELEQYLKHEIIENKYKRICFIGNSMGGYAAILFGVLLDVDRVLVFAPQTFIDKWSRFLHRDNRWLKEIKGIHDYSKKHKRYLKLSNVFKDKDFHGKIDVYYSEDDRLDKIHSEKLKGQKSVSLFPRKKGGHNLIKSLRDQGELITIIKELILS